MKKLFAVFAALTFLVSAVFAQAALDPSRLAVGGRSLGLGRSFVGLADDVNSIFMNPAGLSTLPRWQLTSMAGKFAEEYSYLSLTAAYPTDAGVFGTGFIGASTGGVPVTKMVEGTEADPIYVIDPSQPAIDYYNNVFFLSWAKAFPEIFSYKLPWDFRLGANLKIFNTSLSGDSITDGVGTGTEMDAGIKLKPLSWLSLGAAGRNILPYSMGGKLTYSSGYSEYYPAVFTLGGAATILGEKEDSLMQRMNQKLVVLLDAELNRNTPMLLHLGAEWNPHPIIAIRGGIDQDASVDQFGNRTVENGLAYGVGLLYGGFRFDYAYHAFPGLPGIDNHYFSFTYGLAEAAKPVPKEKVVIDSPPDKLITFDTAADVRGRVVYERVDGVSINGEKAKLGLRGDFKTTVNLKEGKNAIVINGFEGKDVSETKKVRVLRLRIFPDVAKDYWVAKPVSLLAMQNIITGYPNGTFKPEGNITRAEMCTLLMKTRGQLYTAEAVLGTPEVTGFTDVAVKHWAAAYVARAARLKVVLGYPDGTFKPAGNITRAEGLAMIARFAGIPELVYANEFKDVGASHWAAKTIAGAYQAKILEYLKGKDFEPGRLLSRAETVEMLQRTQTVQDVLAKDLLNWDSY